MTYDDLSGKLPAEHATAPGEPSSPLTVLCPFCHSTETERFGLFGAQLSTAQYYCRACHTPFAYLRQEPPPGR